MRRVPIRDSRSEQEVKPRVLDYVWNDDGTEFIEIKDRHTKATRTILLSDFIKQVRDARMKRS